MPHRIANEPRNKYKTLVRKPEWKIPYRRPRCVWEADIKMDLKLIECEADWIYLAYVGTIGGLL